MLCVLHWFRSLFQQATIFGAALAAVTHVMVASSAFYTSLTTAQAKEATAATLQTVSERIGSSKSPREAARTDPYTVGLLTAAGTDAAIANELSTTLATGQETGPRGEMALRVLAMVGRGGIQNIRDL